MGKERASLAVFCIFLLGLSSIKHADLSQKTLSDLMKCRLTSYLCFEVKTSASPRKVLPVIDEILWLLKDGKWHNSEEIIEKCSSPKSKVEIGVSFLREYDFIQVDENGRKARLRPLMLDFLDAIQRVEREETLGHKALGVR